MLDALLIAIILPFVAGAVLLFLPGKFDNIRARISALTAFAALAPTGYIFWNMSILKAPAGNPALFRIDTLAAFVALFIALFGTVTAMYSNVFMNKKHGLRQYYTYLLWTIGASLGAAFSNNLLLLLCFWGFLGMTLYILISAGGPESAQPAKKTFIIIGGSDAAMLLGVAMIWHLTGSLDMNGVRIAVGSSPMAAAAFICLAIGAFAKAGAMPFHTWIPDSSETAPVPVMAFLPASVDKLLGIYLLARLTLEIFVMTPGSGMNMMLLAIGAVTIIAAVMMALIQHNLKRLLAYHAVSQVGYMVLGIGTANPIGIAGGLFHMVNHAIYKSCLFFSAGSVEKKAGTTELNKLGGLARFMPITFAACLVASLSISGVPPFNGFFSKWMIYQGLIDLGKSGGRLWILWLATAMFGSALTLASFMKLLYSTFLSPRSTIHDPQTLRQTQGSSRAFVEGRTLINEVPFSMWLPQVALAALCIVFGVFAYQIPLKLFIAPSVAEAGPLRYMGLWNAPLAALLALAGLVIGAVFFAISRAAPVRQSAIFTGGEALADNSGIKAGAFYNTVKDMPVLGVIYRLAGKKVFDIYEEGAKGTFFLTDILRWLHNGVLPTYMTWCLIGMLVIFFAVMR